MGDVLSGSGTPRARRPQPGAERKIARGKLEEEVRQPSLPSGSGLWQSVHEFLLEKCGAAGAIIR